jgi:glycosyltransferase involved in cell wall biosynthesis
LTIVEAMACGRAVVVAQSGGAAELFKHHYDAIGVDPANASALASAIGSLVLDPVLRRRLGEAARGSAVDRFARHRLGPQLLEVYRMAIGARKGPKACGGKHNGIPSTHQSGRPTRLSP